MKQPSAVPRCFVCQKPVDAFMRVATFSLDDDVEFTALCHGQRETVKVPRELFLALDFSIELGEAFKPPMLPGESALLLPEKQ